MSFRSLASYMPKAQSALQSSPASPRAFMGLSWKMGACITLLALSALYLFSRSWQAAKDRADQGVSALAQGSSPEEAAAKTPKRPNGIIKPIASTPAQLKVDGQQMQAWLQEAIAYANQAPKEQLEEVQGGSSALQASNPSLGITNEEVVEYPHCLKVVRLPQANEQRDVAASADREVEPDFALGDIFMMALLCARDEAFQAEAQGLFAAFSQALKAVANTPDHLGTSDRVMPLEKACPDLGGKEYDRGLIQSYSARQPVSEIIHGINNISIPTVDPSSEDSIGFQEQWRLFYCLVNKTTSCDQAAASAATGVRDFSSYKEKFLVKSAASADPSPSQEGQGVFYILFKDSGPRQEPKEAATPIGRDQRVRALQIARNADTCTPGGTEGETPTKR